MNVKRVRLTALIITLCAGIILPLFAAGEEFTVTAPKGWNKNNQSAALAHYMKGPGSFMVTADIMPQNANTPDSYVAFVKGKLGKTFPNIAYEPVVSGKKDGYDTRELKYTVVTSGIKLKYDVLYIFNNGKAYTLTSANMTSLFNAEFAADINAFFKSFRFK